MYFMRVNELYSGDSFGADALLNKTARNATIKTHDSEGVVFVTLSNANYQKSLRKIELKKINRKIEFLQNIPCF